MAQLIDEKSIDLQNLKHGTIFVKASDLKYEEGNWEKHDTYAELMASGTFKVSGSCHLPAGVDPYNGEIVIKLAMHHTMGKVKTEISPPKKETQVDLTHHLPGIIEPIEMGVCVGKYVKFSLTSAEPIGKLQKGLIIYGVTLTPLPRT